LLRKNPLRIKYILIQIQKDIALKSVLNFRDVGGIETRDGRRIREGIVFRSANIDSISRDDIRKLKTLNIKTIVDLRAPYEQKKNSRKINGIERVSLTLDFEQTTRNKLRPLILRKNSEAEIEEISNSLYLEILDASAPAFKKVLELLLRDGSSSVLIHCQAGKDRTGILSALLQLTLDADRQSIINSYLKSNESLIPFFRKKLMIRKVLTLGYFPAANILYAITVKQRNIESVLNRVDNHHGGIDAYIESSGFDMTKLPDIRKMLIVN
jgi:protein-tyrosine phosphatase